MDNNISTEKFLEAMNSGEQMKAGSAVHLKMHELSQEALKITMEINNAYHTPEEILELMEKLTGRKIGERFGLFPPFYTDCGKNTHIGSGVFINSGCKFQERTTIPATTSARHL